MFVLMQGCETGVPSPKGENQGVQQEGCTILWQHICKDEQIRASKGSKKGAGTYGH